MEQRAGERGVKLLLKPGSVRPSFIGPTLPQFFGIRNLLLNFFITINSFAMHHGALPPSFSVTTRFSLFSATAYPSSVLPLSFRRCVDKRLILKADGQTRIPRSRTALPESGLLATRSCLDIWRQFVYIFTTAVERAAVLTVNIVII